MYTCTTAHFGPIKVGFVLYSSAYHIWHQFDKFFFCVFSQLPNDTIIQIWQGDMGDVQRAIDMGYHALYSTCWYLDLIEYGTKWPKYYMCDPADSSMGKFSEYLGQKVGKFITKK